MNAVAARSRFSEKGGEGYRGCFAAPGFASATAFIRYAVAQRSVPDRPRATSLFAYADTLARLFDLCAGATGRRETSSRCGCERTS